MKGLGEILAALLLLLAAAVVGYKLGMQRDVTRTVTDTLYIDRVIEHRDTITNWLPKYIYVPYDSVTGEDTTIIIAKVEKLDTVLVKHNDTLNLNITRYPLPYVHYDVGFNFIRHDSVRTVTETIYLQKPESFFSRFNIGIGAGFGVSKSGGEYKFAPNINLSVYYKLY